MNTMSYKGYTGSVEFSENDSVFYGKVLGIKSLVSYEGTSVNDLTTDFHGAVDDYLSLCERENIKPEKPYKGNLNVKIPPELHKKMEIFIKNHSISLNDFVADAISNELRSIE